MINFNKRNVNILSVFISLIIFSIIIFILNIKNPVKSDLCNNSEQSNISENKVESVNEINLSEIEEWKIEINSLNINAPIIQMKESTPDDASVGHFKETSILGKNIGLIAYNFGKENNYFSNLKELKVGDEIIYKVNSNIRKYKVIKNQIISKDSLKNSLNDNNDSNSYLKLYTYIIDLDTKMRYVCAKQIIDI